MERKAVISILIAVITALISAIIIYNTLIVGSSLKEAGLIGIFLASMFSHLTVIGRDMFVPAFLPMTLQYHPIILGIFAGIGGAIGEVTTYYWGLGISEAFEDQKDSVISKWFEKYGLIAIFLVAASPLPDTPIALLVGSNRFPLRRFLIVEAIGKVILYSIGAAVGGFFFTKLSSVMDELVLSLLIFFASLAFTVIVSWSKSREKVLQFLKRILKE